MAVGFDSADTDFDTVEKTGGAKTSAAPSHSHSTPVLEHHAGDLTGQALVYSGSTLYIDNHPAGTTGVSDSATQDVMNPYIVCYWWKRTG